MAELVKKNLPSLTPEQLLDELRIISEFAAAFEVASDSSMTREDDLVKSKQYKAYAKEIKKFILDNCINSKLKTKE